MDGLIKILLELEDQIETDGQDVITALGGVAIRYVWSRNKELLQRKNRVLQNFLDQRAARQDMWTEKETPFEGMRASNSGRTVFANTDYGYSTLGGYSTMQVPYYGDGGVQATPMSGGFLAALTIGEILAIAIPILWDIGKMIFGSEGDKYAGLAGTSNRSMYGFQPFAVDIQNGVNYLKSPIEKMTRTGERFEDVLTRVLYSEAHIQEINRQAIMDDKTHLDKMELKIVQTEFNSAQVGKRDMIDVEMGGFRALRDAMGFFVEDEKKGTKLDEEKLTKLFGNATELRDSLSEKNFSQLIEAFDDIDRLKVSVDEKEAMQKNAWSVYEETEKNIKKQYQSAGEILEHNIKLPEFMTDENVLKNLDQLSAFQLQEAARFTNKMAYFISEGIRVDSRNYNPYISFLNSMHGLEGESGRAIQENFLTMTGMGLSDKAQQDLGRNFESLFEDAKTRTYWGTDWNKEFQYSLPLIKSEKRNILEKMYDPLPLELAYQPDPYDTFRPLIPYLENFEAFLNQYEREPITPISINTDDANRYVMLNVAQPDGNSGGSAGDTNNTNNVSNTFTIGNVFGPTVIRETADVDVVIDKTLTKLATLAAGGSGNMGLPMPC